MTWWANDAVATSAPGGDAWWKNDSAADVKTKADAPIAWGDVPGQALSNLPSSAYNFASGIAHTVMHPIETANNIADIGKGAYSKAEGALGFEQDPAQKAKDEAAINAVRDFYVNRYGSMEGFKRALAQDPVGVAADASTVLAGPELALAKLPGAAGRVGEVSGSLSRAVNPLSLAAKGIAKVGEPIASNVIGTTTGVGAAPIRQAANAGFAGDTVLPANMRGNVPMADTIDMAQSALGQMRKERSDAYKAGMGNLTNDQTWLNYKPIDDAISEADKMVNFKGLSTSDEATKVLNDIRGKVQDWRNIPVETGVGPDGKMTMTGSPYTIEATDKLKQAIGEIRQGTQPGTLARTVASNVYNAAKNTIIEQAPDYAATMKDYSNASDKINELTKTFSLGEKASQDTQLRKLQSVMRNNVNTNYGQRAKLMDELAQYEPDLPNALAGQSLSSAMPRGLASMGAITLGGGGVAMHGLPALLNPATLAMAPFFSPRLMGELSYIMGKSARAAQPVAKHLPDVSRTLYLPSIMPQATAQ